MSRMLNVVKLQLINKQTYIWVPLIILASAVLVSIAIFAMIPVEAPKFGGGGQAPLWYFFALGLSSLTLTFPFSQALSITRREFFLGTMIAAVGASVLLSAVFVVLGLIEIATDGWGVNGFMFYLPWMWAAGPLAAGVAYFTLAMLFILIGFAGATVFKRWGATVITDISVGIGVVLLGLVFLITRFELWGVVGEATMNAGALGLALWGLVLVIALGAAAYLVLRRATP